MTDQHRTDRSHANRIHQSKQTRQQAKKEGQQQNTGKWIDVPSTETAAADVAYEALRLRLEHVQRMLPLAAHRYTEDLEHVHRLRVSCRRATTALSAFRPLLGRKVKPLKRWLRELRAAAGPARDVDVLLLKLLPHSSESSTGVARLRYIIEPFQRRREKLQRRLVDMAEQAQVDSPNGRLQRTITKCLQSIPRDKQANHVPFGSFAQQGLSASAAAMLKLSDGLPHFKSQETLPANLPKIERLHELRIAVKRFRYSIELFHDAFPASLRDTVYPQVENMQKRLGTLNDHATMQKNFQWLMARPIVGDRVIDLAARIVQQYEAVLDGRLSFLEWWTAEQSGALRGELEILLSNQTTIPTTAQ